MPGGRPPGGPGTTGSPADLLRRRAIGAHGMPAPLAPPASGGLGTLGEEEDGGRNPQASAPVTETVPAGIFAAPKPRGVVTLGNWHTYWDRKVEVQPAGRGGTFNVYLAGDSGPVVMCIHGGGYSGLTWSLVAKKLKDKYRVVAPDMRGHGLTRTENDTDFSKETMSDDIIAIWEHMFGAAATAAASAASISAEGPAPSGDSAPAPSAPSAPASAAAGGPGAPAADAPPAGVLVGHSMGGGLAVWAGAAKRIKRLEGVVVVDVVEGTALAALPHMMNVLAGRPSSFPSLEEAVTWAVRSGMSRNREAAAVSMPGQLQQQEEEEAGGAGAGGAGAGGGGGAGRWTWRTHLELSRPYWEGWYTGLSEAFLQLTCPKALVLAGTDRLDRALTIGQMQGKFQLILMPTAGHAIQEDEPDRTAEHLLGFLKRFRVGEPPLTFPRPPAGVRPVLPVVAGPVLEQK
ncbi:hypothetical protein HXX76_004585 [Chlamydomonas incerta]|uniref:protein phosphatase methylesterase-1 n=1 Tax=Chlamydomonas incerta TaxID=51695 RepID=A0A835T5N2_CHLIN|nr:hypothetical protein HXX76_004585 [Chlamydomonas incerta]|eukprot:KAG2439223.1 hypothetical protein HXX76_004585 [Chlamydomonas incerta]